MGLEIAFCEIVFGRCHLKSFFYYFSQEKKSSFRLYVVYM